jgi:hypothetical protein
MVNEDCTISSEKNESKAAEAAKAAFLTFVSPGIAGCSRATKAGNISDAALVAIAKSYLQKIQKKRMT